MVIRSERGQAVLMDALLFLTVAVVVSTALFSVMIREQPPPDGLQRYVEKAQTALLRSTITFDGRNMTVFETVLLVLGGPRAEVVIGDIREMLDGLLPHLGYHWTVTGPTGSMSVGGTPPSSADLYATSTTVRTDHLGGEVVLSLRAWRVS